MKKIKTLMHEELTKKFIETKLPHPSEDKHVDTILQSRPVPQADSVVLYSASQRANQGRKRFKHTGQTASIYLSDKLGGAQRGPLVHTLSWKGGPVIYDSIPNNQAQTLRRLLDKYIPKDVPVFTDEGYKFYFRINKNHRMVNHNRKSSDPRYRWARNRWSINGVHNQVAEGNHRNLKYNFIAGYSYITPKYSQLYLNEYAFWKNLKYYGWSKLTVLRPEDQTTATTKTTSLSNHQPVNEVPTTSTTRTTSSSDTESRSDAQSNFDSTLSRSSKAHASAKKKCIELLSESCINPVSRVRPDMEEVTGSASERSSGSIVFRKKSGDTVQGSGETTKSGPIPPSHDLGKVSRIYPRENWLRTSISAHTYTPPTLEERKRNELSSDNDDLITQIKQLVSRPEHADLKHAVEDYILFQSRKKKHESASQQLYEFHANQIWEFLGDNEWSDLDSILDSLQISRAKAYRIIRTWAVAGIADVVDRSHPDGFNFKLLYDFRKRIPILPPVRYVLDREEFVSFESRYSQSVQKQYVERKSNAKYQ
ncbi:transposase [Turneriella parva]|nr:transposase [Turneriella parva]